jgi:hypothetical protein
MCVLVQFLSAALNLGEVIKPPGRRNEEAEGSAEQTPKFEETDRGPPAV